MISKKRIIQIVAEKFARTSVCGVEGCRSKENVDLTELKPLDPIDHDSTFVALCEHHQLWADKRNRFAEDMADELREARKEIGQEHIAMIQDLAMPQDGKLREDILMGDVEEPAVALEDAFDERPDELEQLEEIPLEGQE